MPRRSREDGPPVGRIAHQVFREVQCRCQVVVPSSELAHLRIDFAAFDHKRASSEAQRSFCRLPSIIMSVARYIRFSNWERC